MAARGGTTRQRAVQVYVAGLSELRRALRDIDRELARDLQRANKEAAQVIAQDARKRYWALHVRHSGGGVASIRAQATQREGRVAIGGARTPYMLGQEFGSHHQARGQFTKNIRGPYRRGGVRPRQFPRVKRPGWFLYPAIGAGGPRLERAYGDALDRLTRRAFPERR